MISARIAVMDQIKRHETECLDLMKPQLGSEVSLHTLYNRDLHKDSPRGMGTFLIIALITLPEFSQEEVEL